MIKQKNSVKINEPDNVAVALEPIAKGDIIFGVQSLETIPAGHKMALADIAQGTRVIKYGSPIGNATVQIKQGQHVHSHNLKTGLSGIESYIYTPELGEFTQSESIKTFMGYNRNDGGVGIRNEIWIINTVGCVNKIAEKIAEEANRKFAGKTDGIFTFVHPYGCSQLGDDHRYTQGILANMVKHPNAAGVLVLGLGCENNHIDEFKGVLGTWDDNRVKFLNAQDVEDDVATGLDIVSQLVEYAADFKRESIPIGKLVVGLKCGGSDGFSGITANPLTGRFSDILIGHGGSCILTEVPEMFGAETLLMNRCLDENLFSRSVSLINDFKNYFIRYGQEIYENPSPGNKEGGITTLEEKSLGCTQKGGVMPVVDILNYGEMVKRPGLNLLQGPGNDIVAVTNLMAAGAHIVLFTTGRGTPLGGPVPTVKISSNSTLARVKANWIDFDAGVLLEDASMDDVAHDFFNYIIDIASGIALAKNETNGYREIAIFKDGVTL